ncbi:MAG: pyridoxamine 5'-phosphate oxidase family protein [Alistipes sp.]
MVDERILKFLKRHHVLTLATCVDNQPSCSNAFYCYDAERNLFVVAADPDTRHAQEMVQNTNVAASIVLETRIVGKIQGVQICGAMARADLEARKAYLVCFPYTALMDITLWMLTPSYMKLTDNTLGFGKKMIWNK